MLTAALLAAAVAAASPAKDPAAPPKAAAAPGKQQAAAGLERMKSLAGTWTGKAAHGGDAPSDTTVEFRVTGGGSAVVETIGPGTPHEMVTVYHLDGDALLATHYCAAGNQPTLRARRAGDPDRLAFEFVRGTNMKPADMHMHGVAFTFAGADHLRADWTSWKGGKPAGTVTFELARSR